MSAHSLPKWDPLHDLPDDFFLIMYGQRRSGKNTMMMAVLQSMERRLRFHKVHVISKTAHVNKEQYSQFPSKTLYSNASNLDEILDDILKEQEESMCNIREERKGEKDGTQEVAIAPKSRRAKKGGKRKKKEVRGRQKQIRNRAEKKHVEQGAVATVGLTNTSDVGLRRGRGGKANSRNEEKEMKKCLQKHLIILDDVVSENSIRHSPALNTIAVTGRHQNISIIIMSHMVRGSGSVPPIIRTQADTIVVVAITRSANEMKTLVNEYLCAEGRCDAQTKRAAEKLLVDVTSTKFKAMVIDNSAAANSTSASDFLSTYGPTADPPTRPDFVVGNAEQWQHEEEDEREQTFRDDEIPTSDGTKRGVKQKGRFNNLELVKPKKPKFLPSVFGD